MPKKLTEQELMLWHAWKRATETVRARVAAEITSGTGLSDGDFGVLTRLVDLARGTLRQNELAASMGWHRSRMSHHLTRMEARGLIERRPVEGGVDVVITATGRDAAAASRPVHAAAVRRHLTDLLHQEERASIQQVLERLAAGPQD